MKKFLVTGLAIILSSGAVMAQYDDDAYSPSNNRSNTREESYYDRNDGRERYNEYDENDGYIDYDDDSYTTRFRRFNSIYMGYNYWSPAYSPYWANPFYMDPFWYSPYRPGFSIGWGWGGGPYWSSAWGFNNWWGYGGFGYWNSPYYGGWGSGWGGYPYYGGGYWNNGEGWGRGRTVNYGPRTGFGSARNSSFGVRPAPGTAGNANGYIRRGSVAPNNGNSGRIRPTNNGVMDRSSTPVRMRDNAPSPRYNNNRNENVAPPVRDYDRGNNNRSYQPQQQPTRTYSPAPSRSFDGGGSRGGGGFNSGGGSRGGGGGYRR